MKVVAIIPARIHSVRLPGKVLLDIHGKSILQRVHEQTTKVSAIDEIWVATDSQKIQDYCIKWGLQCIRTSDTHQSGTDRVAEAAKTLDADIIINVQGDEPFIEPSTIESLVELMKQENVEIGTLSRPVQHGDFLFDYNTVKVVCDVKGKVLYFSRQAIPAQRDHSFSEWIKNASYYQHLGIYGFKKATLSSIAQLEPSTLEKVEKLEQLRWMENGYSIYCKNVQSNSFGIDTREDLERARKIYK